MNQKLTEGASIVINNWLKVKKNEKVLIIYDSKYIEESKALADSVLAAGAMPELLCFDGIPANIERRKNFAQEMAPYQVVISASDYSLITTGVVKKVTLLGTRFLSLPLVTLNGQSMLEFEFIRMNPLQARLLAEPILNALSRNDTIRVTTALGTDIRFRYQNRTPSCLYGLADKPGDIGSASFEIYIAIEEDQTEGIIYLDGSMGQIGLAKEIVPIRYKNGRIIEIAPSPEGERLKRYIEGFKDERLLIAAEFGLGLNQLSRCLGHCYIEDESAFSTFHIGHGRNLTLGGNQNAEGHFDLVVRDPSVYVGQDIIYRDGQLMV